MLRILRLPAGLNRSINASKLVRNSIFTWSHDAVGGFTSATKFEPHTDDYLEDQKSYFASNNSSAEVTRLTKGTILWGPSITRDILLGSQAVYPHESLSNLSENELDYITGVPGTMLARYELKDDIDCILSATDNNHNVYYIHHSKLRVIERSPIEELEQIVASSLKFDMK